MELLARKYSPVEQDDRQSNSADTNSIKLFWNVEGLLQLRTSSTLEVAYQPEIIVGELPIWDRGASILASMWVTGDRCSTSVGTGSKHKRGSYVHLLDRVCIINLSFLPPTWCIQLISLYFGQLLRSACKTVLMCLPLPNLFAEKR